MLSKQMKLQIISKCHCLGYKEVQLAILPIIIEVLLPFFTESLLNTSSVLCAIQATLRMNFT